MMMMVVTKKKMLKKEIYYHWSDEKSKYLQVSHISSIRKRTVEKVIKNNRKWKVYISTTHGFYLTVEDELFMKILKGESKIWVKDGNHKVWDTVEVLNHFMVKSMFMHLQFWTSKIFLTK